MEQKSPKTTYDSKIERVREGTLSHWVAQASQAGGKGGTSVCMVPPALPRQNAGWLSLPEGSYKETEEERGAPPGNRRNVENSNVRPGEAPHRVEKEGLKKGDQVT